MFAPQDKTEVTFLLHYQANDVEVGYTLRNNFSLLMKNVTNSIKLW